MSEGDQRMSTAGKFGRSWRRRNVVGATAIVAVVVVSLLTVGAASGRIFAQHRSGDASAGRSAMSSTHRLSHAQRYASRFSLHAAHHSTSSLHSLSLSSFASPFAPIT